MKRNFMVDSEARKYYKEKIYKIVKLSSGMSMFPYEIYSWIEGAMGRLKTGYITCRSNEIYFTGNFELLKIYPPVTVTKQLSKYARGMKAFNKSNRQIFLSGCLIEEVKKC